MHMVVGRTPWYATEPVIGCVHQAMSKQFYSKHHIDNGFSCRINSSPVTLDLFNGPPVYYNLFLFSLQFWNKIIPSSCFSSSVIWLMYFLQQPAVPSFMLSGLCSGQSSFCSHGNSHDILKYHLKYWSTCPEYEPARSMQACKFTRVVLSWCNTRRSRLAMKWAKIQQSSQL